MSQPGSHTRRTFLKTAGGAILVLVTPVPLLARASDTDSSGSKAADWARSWMGPPGEARHRIEGLAKITGQKIYVRDFRARDMEGWPDDAKDERVALVLRVTRADRRYLGYDLSVLGEEFQPETLVDEEQLAKAAIGDLSSEKSPGDLPQGLMVALGAIPVYVGQPVAILIFRDADTCRAAKRRLQFNPDVVRYGRREAVAGVPTGYSPPTHLTRYLDRQTRFSQVNNGVSNPFERPLKGPDREAIGYRDRINVDIQNEGWSVHRTTCTTQILDPMFMEPESGLGWFDRDSRTLHLVLGTQDPNGAVGDVGKLFGVKGCQISVKTVKLTACFLGGGFGGRDTSPLTPLLLIASVFAKGPVRIANDRFEQFQSGIKQLGSRIDITLAIDDDGRFQAFQSTARMHAGGKNNYSAYVASLAGYLAAGGYFIPRVSIDSIAQPTAGVVAGSMRGFGGPQAAFALETLVDEAAAELGVDAIELRRRNALEPWDGTVMGGPVSLPIQVAEICERARRHPLWERRSLGQDFREEGLLQGVGFALFIKAFGTNSDGVMCAVEIDPEGRITVQTNAVDMGNGSATTLALIPARRLGANATSIHMGQVPLFEVLDLSMSPPVAHMNGKRTDVHEHVAAEHEWDDPDYTGHFAMSSGASITAFQQVHAADQASSVLFRAGLWPAALSVWGIEGDDPKLRHRARWRDGELHAPGRRSLSLAEIAARAHSERGVVGAMVHAYFSGDWVSADYEVQGAGDRPVVRGHWPIDGLATRRAGVADFVKQPRSNTVPPPNRSKFYGRSLFTPVGTLAAVEVDPASGKVRVTDVYSFIDAGPVLQPDLLSGQYQGGVAMGVGYALLEDAPPLEGGPGEGDWNLDRYHVALAGDLPLDRIDFELMPPRHPSEPSKAVGEAVLCPVPAAIANAVANATNRRFHSLPITPAKIKRALRDG